MKILCVCTLQVELALEQDHLHTHLVPQVPLALIPQVPQGDHTLLVPLAHILLDLQGDHTPQVPQGDRTPLVPRGDHTPLFLREDRTPQVLQGDHTLHQPHQGPPTTQHLPHNKHQGDTM